MDNSQLFLDQAFWLDNPGLPTGMEYPIQGQSYSNEATDNGVKRRKARVRASRACIACRSRHSKCDGIQPVCTRCQAEEKTCVYTQSRRGGSGRALSGDGRKALRQLNGGIRVKSGSGQSEDLGLALVNAGSAIASKFKTLRNKSSSSEGTIASTSEVAEDGGELLNRYFEFFHNAHPIILPRRRLLARVQNDPDSLEYLLPVIKYIGALYTPGVSTDFLRQIAHEKLNSPDIPANGFSVQALLLFSLATHCSDDYKAAEAYLDKALDIAMAINMNTASFAWSNAEFDATIAESWRRTWWTLYCIDSLFAAISHYNNHRLQNYPMDVGLPCEDEAYNSGKIYEPHYLSLYDSREFSEEEIIFSSFTYLIDACRLISSQITINLEERGPDEHSLEAADAQFVNWFLYLPKCKQDLVSSRGKVDETMFLAVLITNCEKLLLHRPHSNIPYSPLETRSKCTPPSSRRQTRTLQKSMALHTAKSLEAIEASISLFALPTVGLKHSPMVSCALALAIMAQVGGCKHVYKVAGGKGRYEKGRQRIRLGLGALRSQRAVWGVAGRSVRETVGVARELLGIDVSVSGAIGTGSVNSVSPRGSEEEEERVAVMPQSFVDMLSDEALVLADSGGTPGGGDAGMQYITFGELDVGA